MAVDLDSNKPWKPNHLVTSFQHVPFDILKRIHESTNEYAEEINTVVTVDNAIMSASVSSKYSPNNWNGKSYD